MKERERSLLFYVTGHGYGHAARTAELARAVARRGSVATIHIRTTAPPHLFAGIEGARVVLEPARLDTGAVELDPLRIDPRASLERASELLGEADELARKEAEFVREHGVSLIVADAPYLAGDVAERAGVPCLAFGNFTWDWIYEPWVERFPEYTPVLERARGSYAKMQGWLRLPFSHESSLFPEVLDVPLVVRKPARSAAETFGMLALPGAGSLPRVLVGMRGGVSAEALVSAASGAGDWQFLHFEELPEPRPRNLARVSLGRDLSFTDVLTCCELVLSKPGYGVVAECAAWGARLLWPARADFREDSLTMGGAPRFFQALRLPARDYEAGNWAPYLRALHTARSPHERMRADGAEGCAEILEGWMRR